ncbi:ShET2/EspL2 family type III secretion system effector toxin [Candidatus Ichthyocystis sparus]|uniref:ShET2/EspL2 family type III secretion system effector toxin n=2 Tax=Candidatus Ichthyocystis TaxID=2929841 RepID=UPI000B8654B8|nr:ShET2/EspL2 family type III secretion system effector toxin [Candidatus Ichthyocystis sparus]
MACRGDFSARISAFSGKEIPLSSDKTVPYISKKNVGAIAALNSTVQVRGDVMNCPELSALYVYKCLGYRSSGERFKVYDWFGDEKSISKAAPGGIFALYDHILNKSSNRCILVCSKFGHFLNEIATNTGDNSQRLFLLSSCSHVMALRVVCKLKTNHLGNEERRYVAHIFDPNKTNVTARSEVSDPSFFLDESKFSLRKFIDDNLYFRYFKSSPDAPEEHEFMICECRSSDIEGVWCFSSRNDPEVSMSCLSKLETLLHDSISECALYLLMESGLCTKSIEMMSEKLPLLPPSVRKTVVFGRNSDNVSALHVALSNNRHHSIQAYCRLLGSLSDYERIELLPRLLIASDRDGCSGLLLAMQEDCYESINAFGSLLDILLLLRTRIPVSRLARIVFGLLVSDLEGEGEGNVTGLFLAMREGCCRAISAFGSLLDRLIRLSDEVPASEIAEMVFTILKSDVQGESVLFVAMKRNRSHAIDAFGELLDRFIGLSGEVPALDIAKMLSTILMSINARGVTGLCGVMQYGKASTICSFANLLRRLVSLGGTISGDHLEGMVFDILLASGYDGSNGLFEALKGNREGVIRGYFSLLSMIGQSKWPGLLSAKNTHGITGILFANEETISFYLSMLKGCTVDVLSGLLSILESVRHADKYAELASIDSSKIEKYENFLIQLRGIINP